MEDKNILLASTDTLTAKPISVTLDVYPLTWWHKLLIKWRWRSRQKTYTMRPVLVGNMYRIAAMVNQLPADMLQGNLETALQHAVTDHLDKIIYVVAVGLQNDRKEPTPALLNTIRHEFTTADMAFVMRHLMQQLNLKDFLNSIVLAKGMNILAASTSPTAEPEIIAGSTTPGS